MGSEPGVGTTGGSVAGPCIGREPGVGVCGKTSPVGNPGGAESGTVVPGAVPVVVAVPVLVLVPALVKGSVEGATARAKTAIHLNLIVTSVC
jgi:hypothetical protein